MQKIIVIFYSFSDPSSLKIKNTLLTEQNVRSICCDYEHIKEKILNDNLYSIKHVPSILVLYEDGTDEIYQDEDECLSFIKKSFNNDILKNCKIQKNPFLFDIPEKNEKEEEKININDIAQKIEKDREDS